MKNMRLFSKEHIWVLQEGNTAALGITDYAQEKLGDIMFLNLPDEGEALETGKRFGDIESIKTVSDLVSPVAGKVLHVNEALVDEPERINEDPYDSWLIRVGIESIQPDLMDEEAYLSYKEKL